MPPLTDENRPPSEPAFTILHHSKHKNKQLSSNLMLTSTLLNNKTKINKIRMQRPENQYCTTPTPLLTTNKLNMVERRWQDQESERIFSNIQQLKHQAKKLQEEKVIKLGKENIEIVQTMNSYPESIIELPTHKIRQRKMNKRKIVKGRPQMYAIIKKRKFLTSLNEDQPKGHYSINNDQSHIREIINEILHKHHRAEIYAHKYHTPMNKNDQIYHLGNEKSVELIELPPCNRRQIMKVSVSSFKTIQNAEKRNKMLMNDITSPRIRPKQRHHSLVNRRFSVSNTIE